uniref:Uncharacterized protein n=1 Tax=Arion vulgaris TaxID=1028688 RepID=A0A0B7A1I0_9EUPU
MLRHYCLCEVSAAEMATVVTWLAWLVYYRLEQCTHTHMQTHMHRHSCIQTMQTHMHVHTHTCADTLTHV